MIYKIVHTTSYKYSEPVSNCHNEARLRPLNTTNQSCLISDIKIDPTPSFTSERMDFFGNQVVYFDIEDQHTILTVSAVSTVEKTSDTIDFDAHNELTWEQVVESLKQHNDEDVLQARQYILSSPSIEINQDMVAYAERSFLEDRLILDAVHDLMERIHRDFTYDPHFTTIATPLSDVLKHRRGVCQDFAHLAIACLRSMGLAARYVSGYIETTPPKGQARLVGADASHAWFSVYVPQKGWIDFDPTNNQMPMEQHITVAVGRDYHDVTPLKGVIYGGGKHTLDVSVDVARLKSAINE